MMLTVTSVTSNSIPRGRRLLGGWLSQRQRPSLPTRGSTAVQSFTTHPTILSVLELSRGGSEDDDDEEEDDEDKEEEDDDDDDEEEEDDDEDEESPLALTSTDATQVMIEEILVVSQKAAVSTVQFMTQVIRVTSQALQRCLHAALMEEPEQDADLPTLGRIGKGLERMVIALLDFSPTEATSEDDEPKDKATAVPLPERKIKMQSTTKKQLKSSNHKRGKPQDVEEGDSEESNDDDETGDKQVSSSAPAPKAQVDFGDYLQKAYQLEDSAVSRKSMETPPCIVHSGSLSDALALARSQARLLLVLIPSHPAAKRASKKANNHISADVAALTAFLSKDVSRMANRKARKSGPKGGQTGSFVLWSALPGSPEATAAMKRLKLSITNSQGTKRPILAAVYAARPTSGGGRGLVPKLLAQHHASPPPSPDIMAAWMNALRKRHAARYVQMQKELQEIEWFQERKAGYHSSAKTDREEQERQEKEEALEKERQLQEEQRQAALLERRKRLEQDLPDEPEPSADVKTIALRLSASLTTNTTKGEIPAPERLKRRFSADTPLATIFDWVDVVLELERETVILTTLNGKQSFSWNNVEDKESTVATVGSSKMMAFWVKTQEEEKEDTEDDPKSADSKED